jgi:hypothetical protein
MLTLPCSSALHCYECCVQPAPESYALFVVRGHTRNDVDRGFGLISQRYRRSNVYTGEQVVECIREAGVDLTADKLVHCDFRDFETVFSGLGWKKCDAILKHHYFEFNDTDLLGKVRCRPFASDPWCEYELFNWSQPLTSRVLLAAPTEREPQPAFASLTDDQYAESVRRRFPAPLPYKGYKPIKEHDLFNKLRPYFPAAYRDQMAPVPTGPPPPTLSAVAPSRRAQQAVANGQDWSRFDPAVRVAEAHGVQHRRSSPIVPVLTPPSAEPVARSDATRSAALPSPSEPTTARRSVCRYRGCDGTGHRRWQQWRDVGRCTARWLGGHTTAAGWPRKHSVIGPSAAELVAYRGRQLEASEPPPAPLVVPAAVAVATDPAPPTPPPAPLVVSAPSSASTRPKRKSLSSNSQDIRIQAAASEFQGRRTRRRTHSNNLTDYKYY